MFFPSREGGITKKESYILLFLIFCISNVAHAKKLECNDIADLHLPNTEIVITELVPEGYFNLSEENSYQVPGFCRIQGLSHPSSDSNIRFEIWMPLRNWNGRYYQVGNGGFSGVIDYLRLAALLRSGSAVSATDDGHDAAITPGATWALNHPEKIIDYGYRSLKVTADNARATIRAFYGTDPSYSYFFGCSNGGRQALMVAQRFPDEWDGILVGAPANYFTDLVVWFANSQYKLLNSLNSYISRDQLALIQQASLASCDSRAHLVDGVVSDPRYCYFKPESLMCKSDETNGCLTGTQLSALKEIVNGPSDPKTKEKIISGAEPTMASAWGERSIVSENKVKSRQLYFANGFFSNMVYDDPNWSVAQFDLKDALGTIKNKKVAGEPLEAVLNATDPDLDKFAAHNGKIIMYFGWGDPLLSPRSGIKYYNSVRQKMGIQRTGHFFRLFMVPGMHHCNGGPGPNSFGQLMAKGESLGDMKSSVVRALEAWVENGIAPEKIIATKYVNDASEEGVAMTRPLCPYPQIAVYTGKGSTKEANNFVCKVYSK